MTTRKSPSENGSKGRYTDRYEVLSQTKVVQVYPNGYGLVRFDTVLLVTSPAFAGPLHYIGLSETVPADYSLPAIAQLCSEKLPAAPNRNFMNYTLIRPRYQGFTLTPTELPTQKVKKKESIQWLLTEGRSRSFLLEIAPKCAVGQEISYSWEWGFPHLFETSSGKHENSCFECLTPVKQLSLEVHFMRPQVGAHQLFAEEPILKVIRAELDQELSLDAEGVEHLDYLCYRWAFAKTKHHDRFKVDWQYI